MEIKLDGVEAEKEEAMRRYNNRKTFRSILRAIALASLIYLWFPTVAVSVRIVCDWFYKTGAGILTNRTFVFFFANLLILLIFVLSSDNDEDEDEKSSEAKPDLYEQYTCSSSTGIVTVSEYDDEKSTFTSSKAKPDISSTSTGIVTVSKPEDESSKTESDLYHQSTNFFAGILTVSEDYDSRKQIVPVTVEAKRETVKKGGKRIYRRTRSELKTEDAVREHRRTESANIERLNSEEFRMEIEAFIKKKKMNIIRENVVVELLGNLQG